MITFISQPFEGFTLNAFNNNVFVFESDSTEIPLYCTITADYGIGTIVLEITPINNVFYFNTKEVLSYASFKQKFEDNQKPILGFQNDEDILRTLTIDFVITFADTSTDSITVENPYIRGVEQINELTPKNVFYLLCLENLTAFRGYPFDFAINYITPIITNQKNGNEISSNTTLSSRVFISDGQLSLSDFKARVLSLEGGFLESAVGCFSNETDFLELGINTLTLKNVTEDLTEMTIDLKDICDGVYLKWINEFGTWNYWLFSRIYKTEMQTSTQGIYNVDYLDITQTRTVELSTGKKAQDLIRLNAQTLTENQMKQIQSIFVSPRVELYNGIYGQSNNIDDFKSLWQTVQVADGTTLIKQTKRGFVNVQFQIKKNRYTQT